MIYTLLNSDTYFKLPYNIEKEFEEEMDAIITMLELSGLEYSYGLCERQNVGKNCACDGHIMVENGSQICFFVNYTGFLEKMQVFRDYDLAKQYYMGNFMEAIHDFKKATWEARDGIAITYNQS
ncbi:MAG: hypothetical protein K0R18_88 [Bacillales bacterium]|jgi:hypothetical protein|nr:hypothetical protein [Bacillales bacterium]